MANQNPTTDETLMQRAILEAMAAANPDIEGDLMRHLDARGVGYVIRAVQEPHMLMMRLAREALS